MAGRKFEPTDFDLRLGQVIMMTRNRFGWSQKDLARSLGITFQQIQKYETGGNRITVGRLQQIADCFEMNIAQLLECTNQKYLHESDIMKTIDLMYKMTPKEQRFILQAASYVRGGVVPGPVFNARRSLKKMAEDNA